VEQVEHHGRADFGIFEEIGHVEADEARGHRHFIDLTIEGPAHWATQAPAFEPGADPFGIGMAQHLAQRPDRAGRGRQAHHRIEAFVNQPFFGDR
jgi:hypothetical protein